MQIGLGQRSRQVNFGRRSRQVSSDQGMNLIGPSQRVKLR